MNLFGGPIYSKLVKKSMYIVSRSIAESSAFFALYHCNSRIIEKVVSV